MHVSFNIGEMVNGFKITTRHGVSQYVASNEDVFILFNTDAGEGRNYSRILSYVDRRTDRCYQSPRYTIKYVRIVQEMSNVLFQRYQENNKQEVSS